MSYMALYRKFRPQDFEDVKGQEHIVTSLKNQVKAGRLGHAYLFTGTRGTGKTTVAKVLAKAVNCENPVDGSPCNECAICRHINDANVGISNVIEIDAASNNGVDSIREINEEVTYKPTEGKYKVYIIDEVHMLSAGAFNAMLKTLEEPPSHVIFILATTEIHKIPITILSRCQRYDFRRISIETITDRLRDLCAREQVVAEEEALRYVAKAGDGSMRDALSLLDQCIAFYLGQELTYDKVLTVLGGIDNEIFSNLLQKVLQREVTGVMAQLEEMVTLGRDLNQFVIDFTWYLRNILLIKDGVSGTEVLELTSEQLALMKEEAKGVEAESLMRFIRVMSELSNQLKYSNQKRVLIEIALIKLCRPQMEDDKDSLVDRIAAMESQLKKGVTIAQPTSNMAPAGGMSNGANANQAPVKRELPSAMPEDVKNICQQWGQIVSGSEGVLVHALKPALVSVSDQGELLLVYDESDYLGGFDYAEYLTGGGIDDLKELIASELGLDVPIKVDTNKTVYNKREIHTDAVEILAKEANIDKFEIIEEDD